MNYKISLALTVILITATLIALGCTGSIASRQNGGIALAATADTETDKNLVSNGEDTFVPLAADDSETNTDLKIEEYKGEKIVKTEAEGARN